MTIKLQIPIDKDIRDKLETRAKTLGFDSTQAYIRVWAKAEVDGRTLDFGDKPVSLSPAAAKRYGRMIADLDAEKKDGKVRAYTTVSEFMKDLK